MITRNKYNFSNLLLRARGEIQRLYRVYNEFCSPIDVPSDFIPEKSVDYVRQPIIIVGCGHSGTTMLFNVLSEHPNLIPTKGFPDGEDTDMWVKVCGALISGFVSVNSRTPHGQCLCLPMDGSEVESKRIRFAHHYLLRQYPQLNTSGYHLLNKNPHLSNKIKFIHKIFPDAKIIHIVRHPYAMISSWKRLLAQFKYLTIEIPQDPTSCLNAYPNGGWSNYSEIVSQYKPNLYNPSDRQSVKLLARYWLNINLNIGNQIDSDRQDCYLRVRYEDILDRQVETLSDILNHCGLPPKNNWILKAEPKMAAKWRSHLSSEECVMIRGEIGAIDQKFGYNLMTDSL